MQLWPFEWSQKVEGRGGGTRYGADYINRRCRVPQGIMPYFRGLSDEVSCVAIQQREDVTPQTTLNTK